MTSLQIIARQIQQNIRRDVIGLQNSRRFLCSSQSWRRSETSPPAQEQETAPPPQSPTEFEKVELQLENMKKEIEEYKDKYRRLLADRENDRLRVQRELKDSKLYSIQGFSKDLLQIADAFELALANITEEEVSKAQNDSFKSLFQGLSSTESKLVTVFGKHKLTAVPTQIGDAFDPTVHQAMLQEPVTAPEQEPGTIARVWSRGWMLHDRCIRPAKVTVFQS